MLGGRAVVERARAGSTEAAPRAASPRAPIGRLPASAAASASSSWRYGRTAARFSGTAPGSVEASRSRASRAASAATARRWRAARQLGRAPGDERRRRRAVAAAEDDPVGDRAKPPYGDPLLGEPDGGRGEEEHGDGDPASHGQVGRRVERRARRRGERERAARPRRAGSARSRVPRADAKSAWRGDRPSDHGRHGSMPPQAPPQAARQALSRSRLKSLGSTRRYPAPGSVRM